MSAPDRRAAAGASPAPTPPAPPSPAPTPAPPYPAPPSLARHLTRGAIGFGLIGSAFALTPSLGPAALLLAPGGMVALRGCPTCWVAGLVETVSAGRVRRTCTEDGCELRTSPTPATKAR